MFPVNRYNPVHELVKRTIAEGKIGKGEYQALSAVHLLLLTQISSLGSF